jgi:hypothetical protein
MQEFEHAFDTYYLPMVATGKSTAALPAIVRGSPKRITDLMEAFQDAYLRGILAAAGCVVVGKPEIDEGVDLMLSHRSITHADDEFAFLQVQLKSSAEGPVEDGKFVKTILSKDRFNTFRNPNPSVHRIVVILHLPEDQKDWLQVDKKVNAMLLHHRAYWVSVEGQPVATTESVTVKAPTSQVFDDLALCKIMSRIGQGGAP